jgi:hypothetical protein
MTTAVGNLAIEFASMRSLSAHRGERVGVRWACEELAHLTLPLRGPLPLPPMGGEGE